MIHLAEIPGHTGSAQHRSGEAPVDGVFLLDRSQPFNPATENRVVGDQLFVFVDLGAEPVTEITAFLQPSPGQISGDAADAEVVVVDQPLAGGGFPEVVDHLPLAEDVEERGLGPHVCQEGSKPEQVVGDAVEFQHQHPDVARPLGHRDVRQFFRGVHHDRLVEHPRRIVHAAHVGHEHHVRAVLGDLLHAAMEVTDHRFAVDHVLTIEGDHEPQHPVHGGVVGPEVHHHGLRARFQLRHGSGGPIDE